MKILLNFWRRRFDRFYRYRRWHLLLDALLILSIIVLTAAVFILYFYRPQFDTSFWKPTEHQEIKFETPPLITNFSLEKEVIDKEEGVVLKVELENTADYEINQLNINVNAIGGGLAIDNLSLLEEGSGLILEENEIKLVTLGSKNKLTTEIKVDFKTINSSQKFSLLGVRGQYEIVNQIFKFNQDLPILKYQSSLVASAAAYYNSPQGDQLGSGPLPPVVGLPTNFWVFLKVASDGDFRDFSMSAKLPKNVELTENSSLLAGNLSYNQDSRQVVWKVEKILANNSDYRAGFEVRLTPDTNQVGNYALLLSNLRFQSLDEFTSSKVEGSVVNIDSSLPEDALNRGDGQVIRLEDL